MPLLALPYFAGIPRISISSDVIACSLCVSQLPPTSAHLMMDFLSPLKRYYRFKLSFAFASKFFWPGWVAAAAWPALGHLIWSSGPPHHARPFRGHFDLMQLSVALSSSGIRRFYLALNCAYHLIQESLKPRQVDCFAKSLI